VKDFILSDQLCCVADWNQAGVQVLQLGLKNLKEELQAHLMTYKAAQDELDSP